ncbi:hypothetical protein CTH30272_03853 [Allocatenococcus thiocycli]|jgi:hypothetical protein|nr:hypothetical protein CTH30272_03853 [Catenococcus thiocycli]
MDDWELKVIFNTMDNYKIELGSYKDLQSNILAEWLLAGYTK